MCVIACVGELVDDPILLVCAWAGQQEWSRDPRLDRWEEQDFFALLLQPGGAGSWQDLPHEVRLTVQRMGVASVCHCVRISHRVVWHRVKGVSVGVAVHTRPPSTMGGGSWQI